MQIKYLEYSWSPADSLEGGEDDGHPEVLEVLECPGGPGGPDVIFMDSCFVLGLEMSVYLE